MHSCLSCQLQLSKLARTEEEQVFCSEECQNEYNKRRISVLPDDVIDNVLIPFIPLRELFLLHLNNSLWKYQIKTYVSKHVNDEMKS
jgi:hypothetical protein